LPEPAQSPSGDRRRRRLAGPVLLLVALIAASVAIGIGLDRPDDDGEPPVLAPEFEVPQLDVAPNSAVPQGAVIAPKAAATAPRPTTAAVRDWATTLAEKTQIPSRSLVAYAEAELAVRATIPGCRISWATLAGVGRVESHHGEYNGSDVGTDGRLEPPIFGVPLDGSPGVRAIADTDRGRLDGDPKWDRAVGAMQFLPETWTKWGVRANRDGRSPDPQNIDDAALAAANYLCASGGNLATAPGWWDAVLTYNRSVTYGQNVFSGADAYAKAAANL
jgi:membrane-bound lytic murein transglycosylase B